MRLQSHFSILLVCLTTGLAFAQTPEATKPRNDFDYIFPNPTGQNGYEEIVRAGDMLLNATAWREYENCWRMETPTLAMKRMVVANAQIHSVIETLRAGLNKSVCSS